MNIKDIRIFLETLKEINKRDYLIASIIAETGKRMRDVLSLKEYQVHGNMISFEKDNFELSDDLASELNGYIQFQNIKDDLVFKTSKNKKITRFQIYRNLWNVCEKLNWETFSLKELNLTH